MVHDASNSLTLLSAIVPRSFNLSIWLAFFLILNFNHFIYSLGLPDQHDKVAVITGANKGIGFETARALCKLGAFVIMGMHFDIDLQ